MSSFVFSGIIFILNAADLAQTIGSWDQAAEREMQMSERLQSFEIGALDISP